MLFKKLVIFVVGVMVTSTGFAIQDQESDDSKSLIDLIQDLRSLDLLQFSGSTTDVQKSQRERIGLANQILASDEINEAQRIYATISRLQSYGILFSIDYKNAASDTKDVEEYARLIEEGLEDEATEVVLEATTASASFRTGMYIMESSDENAALAAEALQQIKEFEPQLPLIQSTRRILLQQLLDKGEPGVFEKIKGFDEKVAKIALKFINKESTKEEADFQWSKHFAKLDDVISMRQLADMYETGKGTRRNYTQAGRWYSKLAKLGDTRSKVKLGDFYRDGLGFAKDGKTAVEFYREASNAGSRVAQFKLAECYLNGTGVEQSKENWEKWIKAAASNAQPIEVQNIYLTIDFKKSADSYRIFYESLVDQNPNDIYYLNNLAYSLLISSKKDPQKSLELIEKAIENAPEEFTGMSNFVDTKANALKQLGKTQEAAELFESVLDDMDDKKSVLQSLVECYEKLDVEKADKYRQQLETLKLESDS